MHGDLPSTIVHKLARLMTGTKDYSVTTGEQRAALINAMASTREPGQSNKRWQRRAAGLLIKGGWEKR